MKEYNDSKTIDGYNDADRYGFAGAVSIGYHRQTPEEREDARASFSEWLLSLGVFTEEQAENYDEQDDDFVLLRDKWLIFDEKNDAVGYNDDAPQEIKDYWNQILKNREEVRRHIEKYGPHE